LAGEIRRNAGDFLTVETVNYCVDLLRETFPACVDTVLKRFGTTQLVKILRSLLDEEISIRNLPQVLESLLAINGPTRVDHGKYLVFHADPPDLCPVSEEKRVEDLEPADYASCVRMSLKRYISGKYAFGGGTLVYYTMDPQIEMRILNLKNQPLENEERARLISAIFQKFRTQPLTSKPVILTTVVIRRRLRELIKEEFPQLAVLCYQELAPDLSTQWIAQISWN
jgi:type III secretory pathway component EscV